MATTISFPSSGYGYKLKSGTFKFELTYSSGSSSEDSNCEILSFSPIQFYIGPDFSGEQHKFSYFDIVIENINDFFESSAFTAGEGSMFAKLYKDGSLYFSGYVPFDNIEKIGYYKDSGSLKYRKIKLRIYDALYYYKDNNDITLNDISYSDGANLETLLNTAISNVHTGTISFDTSILITESIAGTSYNLSDIIVSDTDSSYTVIDLITNSAIKLGLCLYNYNGVYKVKFRDNSTTPENLTLLDFKILKKIKAENIYKYCKFSATKDWTDATNGILAERTETKDYGTENDDTDANLLIEDDKQFLTKLGIDWDESTAVPTSQVAPSGTGSVLVIPPLTYIIWSGVDFSVSLAETGQLVEFGAHPTYSYTPIVEVNSTDTVYVPSGTYNGNDCNILRNNTYNSATYETMIYKILKLAEWVASQLNILYVSSGFIDRVEMTYIGISEITNPHARISILNENRFIDEMTIDIIKNTTKILTV